MTAQDILTLVQKNSSSISALSSSNDKIDKVISLINANNSGSGNAVGGLLKAAGGLLGKKGSALSNVGSALGGSNNAASIIVAVLSQLKGTNLNNFNINSIASLLGSGSNASALKTVITQIINLIK
ncbi:MAG: hypothetical protein J6Y37_02460 [Paludibacteraceae bacterium]|nr:hypothetical protein [Paludibacteraceae bacterium]